jgi:hypothetical protein
MQHICCRYRRKSHDIEPEHGVARRFRAILPGMIGHIRQATRVRERCPGPSGQARDRRTGADGDQSGTVKLTVKKPV